MISGTCHDLGHVTTMISGTCHDLSHVSNHDLLTFHLKSLSCFFWLGSMGNALRLSKVSAR